MRKTLTRMGFGLALVVGAAGAAAAQSTPNARPDTTQRDHYRWDGEHGGRRGFADGMLLKGINLTDAQKEQVKKIHESFDESTKALREQMRALHDNDTADPLSGNFDEATFRSAAEARAKIQVEMEVQHAKKMSQVVNILTAEQKATLAERHEHMRRMGPPPPPPDPQF